jgi:transposase InsO family protein
MSELLLKHDRLDLIVVAEQSRDKMVRLHETTIQDSRSRWLLYLDLTSRTAHPRIRPALPPEGPDRHRKAKSPPQLRGQIIPNQPEIVVVDSCPTFRSEAFQQICAAIGLQVRYVPAGTSMTKGEGERFFGKSKRIDDVFSKIVANTIEHTDEPSTQRSTAVVPFANFLESVRKAAQS